jgi:hypothetical protein
MSSWRSLDVKTMTGVAARAGSRRISARISAVHPGKVEIQEDELPRAHVPPEDLQPGRSVERRLHRVLDAQVRQRDPEQLMVGIAVVDDDDPDGTRLAHGPASSHARRSTGGPRR